MKKIENPNEKHYFDPIENQEFVIHLKKILSNNSNLPIVIWEKGEKESDRENFEIIHYDFDKKILSLKMKGNFLELLTGSNKANKQVLFKIKYGEKFNLFSAGILTFMPEKLIYELNINYPIYKSQQRESIRLLSSNSIPIQLKINEEIINAFDISAGGISFLCHKIEAKKFPKEKHFFDCMLRFDRMNYYIPELKILSHKYREDLKEENQNILIGSCFINLPQKTKEELLIKVATEARGDEMKKTFDKLLNKKFA